MKKITASILATCMVAGMSTSAVMAWQLAEGFDTSSQDAAYTDANAIRFSQQLYTITNGDSRDFSSMNYTLAMLDYSNTARYVDIQFSLVDNDDLAFALSTGGTVTAIEGSGTATLKAEIIDSEGNVQAERTTTLVATPASTSTTSADRYATGFSFTTTGYQEVPDNTQSSAGAYVNNYTLTISATPSGAIFTSEQAAAIQAALNDEFGAEEDAFDDANSNVIGFYGEGVELVRTASGTASTSYGAGYSYMTATVANQDSSLYGTSWDGTAQTYVDDVYSSGNGGFVTLRVDFPNATVNSSGTFDTTMYYKSTKLKSVDTVGEAVIGSTSSAITVKVGDYVNLNNYFKVGPSNINAIEDGYDLYVDYAYDDSAYNDYAVLSNDSRYFGYMLGVAEGTVKVTATLNADRDQTATVYVTVVEATENAWYDRNTSITSSMSNDGADLTVGQIVDVTITGSIDPDEIKWASGDESVIQVVGNGSEVKFYGLKAGSAIIEAKDSTGTVIATFDLSVLGTSTDATTDDTTTDSDDDVSTNPNTGDSIFKGLFF